MQPAPSWCGPSNIEVAQGCTLRSLRRHKFSEETVALDPNLLDILACPEDKGPLLYLPGESVLYNERLRRTYRIEENDIPIMLIDEATAVDDIEHERLMGVVSSEGITPTFSA